jgi:hypothetical protein
VHPQHLDTAEAPAVALALQGLEGQGHDSLALGLIDVKARPAGPQQAQ